MMVKIKHTRTGNCRCLNCGCEQAGRKYHPYTVWTKKTSERRGHNWPVCSEKCAKEFAEKCLQVDPCEKYDSTSNKF